MVVKSFRGLLEDGGQDHIRLQTIKGKVGYRIVKFQIIQQEPGQQSVESTVKIYTQKQSTINNNIAFTDSSLLAAAIWHKQENSAYALIDHVIFDREIFNQDIFLTHQETDNAYACNYYLELEVIRLTDSDAEFTTLKDIRGRNTTP